MRPGRCVGQKSQLLAFRCSGTSLVAMCGRLFLVFFLLPLCLIPEAHYSAGRPSRCLLDRSAVNFEQHSPTSPRLDRQGLLRVDFCVPLHNTAVVSAKRT